MKLVPLGDRVVLKQVRSRRDNNIRYRTSGTGTGETTAGRSYRSWSWRSCRWQRSKDGSRSRKHGYLLQICRNRSKAGWYEEYIIVKQERYPGSY